MDKQPKLLESTSEMAERVGAFRKLYSKSAIKAGGDIMANYAGVFIEDVIKELETILSDIEELYPELYEKIDET